MANEIKHDTNLNSDPWKRRSAEMNYIETDANCPSCGSTIEDRRSSERTNKRLGLSECPHCNSQKCGMCDMGDDVECPSCDAG